MEKELLNDSEQATLLNMSRAAIYAQERRDPSFPRKVQIPGGRTARRRSELIAWIDSLPRVQLDGVDAVTKRQLAAAERQTA